MLHARIARMEFIAIRTNAQARRSKNTGLDFIIGRVQKEQNAVILSVA